MKKVTPFNGAQRDPDEIDVDALLAAINEISESEITRAASEEDPQRVCVGGTRYHRWSELAEAFELDIHDFSVVSECNR